MKAILTCDDVFEVLTRAPFPSGASDDQVVESHLAVCHECRQLAEALRPAVGLFHEAMIGEAEQELPTYRGQLSSIDRRSDSNVVSSAVVEPLSPLLGNSWDNCSTIQGRRAKEPVSSRTWLGIAGCVAAVLVATLALVASRARSTHNEAVVASNVRSVGDRDVKLLASLDLPNACAPRGAATRISSNYDCCTKCHTAGSRVSSSREAISKSSSACIACHDWLTERASPALSIDKYAAQWRGRTTAYPSRPAAT
jgi:hypothetical protein